MQKNHRIVAHGHFRCLFLFLALLALPSAAAGQTSIDPAGINGALLLCGSNNVSPETFDKFVELAGGSQAKIVVLKVGKRIIKGFPKDGLADAARKKNAPMPQEVDYQNAKE